MQNTIVYASELADQARAEGVVDYDARARRVQELALADHPIYIGMVDSVNYNDKTDRYVAKFIVDSRNGSSSAKVTHAVAAFLLAEVFSPKRTSRPTVYAHMTEGTIDGVLLMYVAR